MAEMLRNEAESVSLQRRSLKKKVSKQISIMTKKSPNPSKLLVFKIYAPNCEFSERLPWKKI